MQVSWEARETTTLCKPLSEHQLCCSSKQLFRTAFMCAEIYSTIRSVVTYRIRAIFHPENHVDNTHKELMKFARVGGEFRGERNERRSSTIWVTFFIHWKIQRKQWIQVLFLLFSMSSLNSNRTNLLNLKKHALLCCQSRGRAVEGKANYGGESIWKRPVDFLFKTKVKYWNSPA